MKKKFKIHLPFFSVPIQPKEYFFVKNLFNYAEKLTNFLNPCFDIFNTCVNFIGGIRLKTWNRLNMQSFMPSEKDIDRACQNQ